MSDPRRVYYDHEPAYRKIAAGGGRGWDDLTPGVEQGSYKALDAFLVSAWAPPRGAAVLELGCGGGQASLRLARLGYAVLGVDYSETAIELARRNAREAGLEARFERGDVLALGAVGPFDLVVDNHLLHCILGADRARVLAEVRRVLRAGGVFFSETMSCEGHWKPEAVKADPVTREARNRTRVWVSRKELEAELAGAGLAVERLVAEQQDPDSGETLIVYARG
jgi:SAM-dependent methyltransferase